MADPATWVALIGSAVSLAGAGAGVAASEGAASAENNAVSNSLQQLQALQNKSTPIVEDQLKASSPKAATADIQTGQQKALGDYYSAQSAALTGTSPQSGSSSSITSAETGAKEKAYTQADANVQGYSNLGQQWQLSDQAARNLLGNITAQGQSVESALPASLAYAKNSTAAEAGIGSLMQTAGGLAATYGAQKGAFSGGGPSTNIDSTAAYPYTTGGFNSALAPTTALVNLAGYVPASTTPNQFGITAYNWNQ